MKKIFIILLCIMPMFANAQQTSPTIESIIDNLINQVNALNLKGKNEEAAKKKNELLGNLNFLKEKWSMELKAREDHVKELETENGFYKFFERKDINVLGDDLNKINSLDVPEVYKDKYILFLNLSELKKSLEKTNERIDEIVLGGKISKEKLHDYIETDTEQNVDDLNSLCKKIRNGGVETLSKEQKDYFETLKKEFNELLDRIDNIGK